MSGGQGGYDRVYGVRTDYTKTRILVRFDTHSESLGHFTVQLQYRDQAYQKDWGTIAEFKHEPTHPTGHDLHSEGLPIDIFRDDGSTLVATTRHSPLPDNPGALLRACVDYLEAHIEYFVRVHRNEIAPQDPPPWPYRPNLGSSHETNTSGTRGLTEALATEFGDVPENVERDADGLLIQDPWDADHVKG